MGTVDDMTMSLNESYDTQTLSFTNTISESHGNSDYCGDYLYSTNPVYSFLQLSNNTMTLSTTNPYNTGGYLVDLDVQLLNFPSVLREIPFNVTINCHSIRVNFKGYIPPIEFDAKQDS